MILCILYVCFFFICLGGVVEGVQLFFYWKEIATQVQFLCGCFVLRQVHRAGCGVPIP